jgi:hypothetical protein
LEGITRKPFQGVTNIIRFNWHFYVIAAVLIAALLVLKSFLPDSTALFVDLFIILLIFSTLVSLAVSYYIYDRSELYSLNWLDSLKIPDNSLLVNINAGFDETSALLKQKYPGCTLIVYDFYDPSKHTEVSIERARKAYPPYPGTVTIETTNVPLAENSAGQIFLILAAHEIRNHEERITFFKQLHSALTPGGRIIVTEHMRDVNNFIAYNFGFFHFFSQGTWHDTFKQSGFAVERTLNITPFIKIFILKK